MRKGKVQAIQILLHIANLNTSVHIYHGGDENNPSRVIFLKFIEQRKSNSQWINSPVICGD